MTLLLRKESTYSELFWSVFSGIQTEYEEKRSISPYSARMRARITRNTDTFHSVSIVVFIFFSKIYVEEFN